MKKLALCIVLLVVLGLTGCGNVYLRGEALTAAETSTLDAYGALQRADPCKSCVDPAASTTQPAVEPWVKAYLKENFCQWRFFVRSARKDLAWGPKLEGE
jgi:hypothetical protein